MIDVAEGLFTHSGVISAIIIGAMLMLVVYVRFGLRSSSENDRKKQAKNKVSYPKDDKSSLHSEKKKEPAQGGKLKKKIAEGRWSSRNEKQSYSHPWLLTSLKGHTGSILDVDFSANGKYLASCGEEDPDPGGVTTESGSNSSSESTQESGSPSPSSRPSTCTKGLSRRQKKNRKREELPPPIDIKKKQKSKKVFETPLVLTKKQAMAVVPLRQYVKFNNSEKIFMGLLHNYLLTHDEMMNMGYPVKYLEQNLVVIYKSPRTFNVPSKFTTFDVNARAFVPKNEQADSGHGSGSSSDSGENFDGDTSSTSSSSDQDAQTYYEEHHVIQPIYNRECYMRTCCRCNRLFYTTQSEYLTKEKCTYHWGKLQTINSPTDKKHGQLAYSCCHGRSGSRGCTESQLHVWSGLQYGLNGVYDDYVFTKPKKTPPPDGNYGVYALDCEMCYTVRGLELTKVTVVGTDGRLVYDSFVKPDYEIVDYNTRFSGVSAKDLKRCGIKNLREVQNDLMGFINANTILIGHGLENDLRALKLVHYCVVDTAHSFPHYNGLPYRRSLKNLTSTILKREIQCSRSGHNSYDDASACMELMLWRVRKDFKSYLFSL